MISSLLRFANMERSIGADTLLSSILKYAYFSELKLPILSAVFRDFKVFLVHLYSCTFLLSSRFLASDRG